MPVGTLAPVAAKPLAPPAAPTPALPTGLQTNDPMHPWMNEYNKDLMAGKTAFQSRVAANQLAANMAKEQQGQPYAPSNDINAYLTNDPTYQQQMAGINQALSNYQAQNNQSVTAQKLSNAQSVANMQEAERQADINLQENFGARGMIHSGQYAVGQGLQNNEYTQQFNQQSTTNQNSLAGFQNDLANFQQQQLLAQQQARQDAINRRAISLVGSTPTTSATALGGK
jgi:hypothetical protein